MTTTSWSAGFSGNWRSAAYWSAGVPDATTTVDIFAPGSYTITVSTASAAGDIWIDSELAVLSETQNGALSAEQLTLYNGTVILRAANTFDFVLQQGGLLEIGNANALGSSEFFLYGGEFRSLADVVLPNKLDLSGTVTIAAATGTTLDLNSVNPFHLDATTATALTFGVADAKGTIVWHSGTGGEIEDGDNCPVTIAGGTFRIADDDGSFLLGDVKSVTIAAGATVDMAGHLSQINNLEGDGRIVNSGADAQLTVFGNSSFNGTFGGGILMNLYAGRLTITGTGASQTTINLPGILQIGDGGTTGTLVGTVVDNGSLVFDRSDNLAQTHGISGTGSVTYQGSGTTTIGRAETYSGGTSLTGGVVSISNANAFGSGVLTIDNGSLLATSTMTLAAASLNLTNSTIAAKHGTVLTITGTGSHYFGSSGDVWRFGSSANDGTVVLQIGDNQVNFAPALVVAGGTLMASDDDLGFVTGSISKTTVEAGATLDFTGHQAEIRNLQGAGTVVSTGGAAITIENAKYAGTIAGTTSAEITGFAQLTGTNTYTNGTHIQSSGALSLGAGGDRGTIVGDIVDDGKLIINHSNAFAETAVISGTGQFLQFGTGTTTIAHANSYTGGTFVEGGILAVDRATAIGNGTLTLEGGEFLATATVALSNSLVMRGNTTIAAAAGKTLTLRGDWNWDAVDGSTIQFGAGANSGIVRWFDTSNAISHDNAAHTIDIHAGTLKAVDNHLGYLLGGASRVTVESGGTINVHGFTTEITNLHGNGTITSIAGGVLNIYGGNFAGKLNGHLSVHILNEVVLSGSAAATVDFTLNGSHLTLANSWTQDVTFAEGGILTLNASAHYTGEIVSFGNSDLIDVAAIDFQNAGFHKAYNASTGVLALRDAHQTVQIHFAGDYIADNFIFSADDHGGTDISFLEVSRIPLASESAAINDWVA